MFLFSYGQQCPMDYGYILWFFFHNLNFWQWDFTRFWEVDHLSCKSLLLPRVSYKAVQTFTGFIYIWDYTNYSASVCLNIKNWSIHKYQICEECSFIIRIENIISLAWFYSVVYVLFLNTIIYKYMSCLKKLIKNAWFVFFNYCIFNLLLLIW